MAFATEDWVMSVLAEAMMFKAAVLLASLLHGAAPATRIAVVLDDPGQSRPASAAMETTLQKLGYEVVAADVSEKMRQVVAPKALLGTRLPDGLSVFEADAIIGGAVSYGEPADVDGVKSVSVSITVRLIDLGTGQATATMQASGVGVGVQGPALLVRGVEQATSLLFDDKGLKTALKNVGQAAGTVTLVVQGLPSRESLLELRRGLERALGGAPVKEIYFAKNLGKLMLGGSNAKSMVGPDIADVIGETKTLALEVDEVANTRIVATYNRARTVQVHALVTEPKVPRRDTKRAEQLGKYVATQLATFKFARASYQAGQMTRQQAMKRAAEIGAQVIIESEVLGVGKSEALAMRVLDAKTGNPILREQRVVSGPDENFETAHALLAALETELPEKLAAIHVEVGPKTAASPTASKDGADK
jgi:hypothetical protein